jgi:hypothetical protein
VSTLSELDVIRAAGGTRAAIAGDVADVAIRCQELRELADRIEQAYPPRDPRVGDAVLISGTIVHLPPGMATVSLYRPDPDGDGWVRMQRGGLEHDERPEFADGGTTAVGGQ